MTLKGDAKFKRKLTCRLKNNLRDLLDFHASSWKSGNLHFDRLLLSKTFRNLDEKVQKCYVSWHWIVMQSLKKKLTLDFKNDMRNLVNFNVSTGKSENLHFDVLLLSIAYKVSAKKVQKNYLSWHWTEIQTLKKNWLFVWKMTWVNLVNFNPSSRKSENLMGYFCRNYIVFELKKIQRTCAVENDIMT